MTSPLQPPAPRFQPPSTFFPFCRRPSILFEFHHFIPISKQLFKMFSYIFICVSADMLPSTPLGFSIGPFKKKRIKRTQTNVSQCGWTKPKLYFNTCSAAKITAQTEYMVAVLVWWSYRAFSLIWYSALSKISTKGTDDNDFHFYLCNTLQLAALVPNNTNVGESEIRHRRHPALCLSFWENSK